jgi:hypothetical protein
VTGTVPPTLSLELGSTANLGSFVPGVGREYEASVGGLVTSSAGDATLSVSDPSATSTGRLVNGTFSLAQAVQARAMSNPFAPVTGTNSPLTLLTYTGPVNASPVTIALRQQIVANEPLRTGIYSKTLTFTLSTTTP